VPGGCFPQTTRIRITSLRANASQLGIPEGGASFPSTQVTAFVSVDGDAAFPISNNVLNVGVPFLGLGSEVVSPAWGTLCQPVEQTVHVKIEEGFVTAFKLEGSASTNPGNGADEAGYPAPGSNGGDGASGPTRFLMRFRNIPPGVTIKAPEQVDSSAIDLTLVTGTDVNGAGGTLSTGSGKKTVALTNGSGFAVYEVRNAHSSTTESIKVPVSVSWPGSLSVAGIGEVAVDFAPLSTVTQASQPAPEPRFIDVGSFNTLLTAAACGTEPPPGTDPEPDPGPEPDPDPDPDPEPWLPSISCFATATPITIRAEGIADLLGDIVLICTTPPPTIPPETYPTHMSTSVSISLAAVNATNNIDFGGGRIDCGRRACGERKQRHVSERDVRIVRARQPFSGAAIREACCSQSGRMARRQIPDPGRAQRWSPQGVHPYSERTGRLLPGDHNDSYHLAAGQCVPTWLAR
jgi:hypothetical protein